MRSKERIMSHWEQKEHSTTTTTTTTATSARLVEAEVSVGRQSSSESDSLIELHVGRSKGFEFES